VELRAGIPVFPHPDHHLHHHRVYLNVYLSKYLHFSRPHRHVYRYVECDRFIQVHVYHDHRTRRFHRVRCTRSTALLALPDLLLFRCVSNFIGCVLNLIGTIRVFFTLSFFRLKLSGPWVSLHSRPSASFGAV